ncbi:MAG: cobalamin-binding protein [Planctomycetota bacterium]
MRIVSLLPSATEIVCALGARDQLVGVSHECDFPSGVEQLPQLTRPRRELPRASGAIDRAVRDIVADALAVYEVDVEQLRALAPDVIVTQDLCDVCAVSLADVHRALAELARDDVAVESLRPGLLADVWQDVERVGAALGRAEEGRRVAAALAERARALAQRANAVPDAKPAVLTIEWLEPVMVGGTWMPELVTLAGGTPLVTEPGQHAPTLDADQLRAQAPDVVLIKPCGFDIERANEELARLHGTVPWGDWPAVRAGRVYVADGNAYFNRPGPRLVESLEILAACLHPEAFPELVERHAGSGFVVAQVH